MNRFKIACLQATVILGVALAVGFAYNGVSPQGIPLIGAAPADSARSLPQVSLNETRLLQRSKETVIVDARAREEYDFGHIPGAVSLPENSFDKAFPDVAPLLKNKRLIVVYCSGPGCELAPKVARRLKAKGYKDIRLFDGGWPAWLKAGQPVEKAKS